MNQLHDELCARMWNNMQPHHQSTFCVGRVNKKKKQEKEKEKRNAADESFQKCQSITYLWTSIWIFVSAPVFSIKLASHFTDGRSDIRCLLIIHWSDCNCLRLHKDIDRHHHHHHHLENHHHLSTHFVSLCVPYIYVCVWIPTDLSNWYIYWSQKLNVEVVARYLNYRLAVVRFFGSISRRISYLVLWPTSMYV